MSEPSWTPGPWTVSGHRSVFKEADGIADGHHGYIVAKTNTHSLIGSAEAHANARLIASAPELYEALEEAAETLGNYSDVLDGLDGDPRPNDAMKALIVVNAAIRKARGE